MTIKTTVGFPFQGNGSRNGYTWADRLVHGFDVTEGVISDGTTHFINEVLRLLMKAFSVYHHLTLPYCPCSNGAGECLGREMLRIDSELLSELKLHPD